MSDFFKYLFYILRHKHYVAVECLKRGLIWRAITHDLSKLRPSEFVAYMHYFYTYKDQRCIPIVRDAFYKAWLTHIHRNDHHWQHHLLHEGDEVVALPMPRRARTEMICDWIGAGKAQGHGDDVLPWYREHRTYMKLHPDTREMVEHQIGYREGAA